MQLRSGLVFVAIGTIILAATPAQFRLSRDHVGKLGLGMPGSEVYKLFPGARTRKVDLQLEGNQTPAVEIYLSPHNDDPALVVRLDPSTRRTDVIEVHDSRFCDETGIHIGSTFGELRKAHSKLDLAVGEGQYWIAPKNTGLSFHLGLDQSTEAALKSSDGTQMADVLSRIPDRTPILSILVYRESYGR